MIEVKCDDVLSAMQERKCDFGQALRFLREKQGMTIRKVAKAVDKTPTYISDIERGNNKPPEKELIEKILNVLEIQEMEIQCYLYDLAARKRGGIPGDMVDYIMEHSNLRLVIRKAQRQKSGEEFWAECLNRI